MPFLSLEFGSQPFFIQEITGCSGSSTTIFETCDYNVRYRYASFLVFDLKKKV